MAHARRGLAQTQGLGRLAVGELLEVAEQDDFAVKRKIVVGIRKRCCNSPAARLGRGGDAGSRSWAARSSEDRPADASEPAFHAGPLAIEAPFASSAVPAVGIDHVVTSDLPKPER